MKFYILPQSGRTDDVRGSGKRDCELEGKRANECVNAWANERRVYRADGKKGETGG